MCGVHRIFHRKYLHMIETEFWICKLNVIIIWAGIIWAGIWNCSFHLFFSCKVDISSCPLPKWILLRCAFVGQKPKNNILQIIQKVFCHCLLVGRNYDWSHNIIQWVHILPIRGQIGGKGIFPNGTLNEEEKKLLKF